MRWGKGTLRMRKGSNAVSREAWQSAVEMLSPHMREALFEGEEPYLAPSGEMPESPEDDPNRSVSYKAVEAAELMDQFETVEEIDAFIAGDERKTVTDAAEKRKAELPEVE